MSQTSPPPVDLRELVRERGSKSRSSPRRHLLTRYVFPAALLIGFLLLGLWAARDRLLPAREVRVVPVVAVAESMRQEGTPLFQAAGWVEPRPTPLRVAALAPGVVDRLLVVEDQEVEAGEVVAELVKDDARLAVERAVADLELRQAALERAQAELAAAETRLAQPIHLEAELGAAEAMLAEIQTQLAGLPFEIRRAEADAAVREQEYQVKLQSRGITPQVELDTAAGRAEAARALVDELENRRLLMESERSALLTRRNAISAQLNLLVEETRDRDQAVAQVRAAGANVRLARVALSEAELRRDRMTVRSPVSGRVLRVVAQPGSRIGEGHSPTPGQDASTVVTLYQPGMLQLRVDVRFEDLLRVSLQQPVRIENPALSEPLLGTVLYVGSEADVQKNTLPVRVSIADPPSVLKPEMLVQATFLAPARSADTDAESSQVLTLYLPGRCVHQRNGEAFVWLADQSRGRARRTAVEVGSENRDGLVPITAGLSVSDRVISTGTDELRDGDRVRVVGEDAATGGERTAQPESRS